MLTLSHKNLEAYSLAFKLAKIIYEITEDFPKTEKYGLCSQIRRAAVSVLSNVAEGASRYSPKEKIRFFEISRASLVEVDTQLELSLALNYYSGKKSEELSTLCNQTFAVITGLIKKNAASL